MNADEETNITDIELLPDGRIYVFGTSLEVLDLLDGLQGGQDAAVSRRLQSQVNISQPSSSTFLAASAHHGRSSE